MVRTPAPASLVAPGTVEVTLKHGGAPWRLSGSAVDPRHEFAAAPDVRSADPSLMFVLREARTTLHLAEGDAEARTSVDQHRADQGLGATAADTPFAQISVLAGLPAITPPDGARIRPDEVSFHVLPSAFAELRAGSASASAAIQFDVCLLYTSDAADE